MRSLTLRLNVALAAGAAAVVMNGCAYRYTVSANGGAFSGGSGARYSTTSSQALPAAGVKRLKVDTDFGSIDLSPATDDKIGVSATINVDGPVPTAALQSIAGQVKVVQSASGDEVVLKPVLPKLPPGVGVGVSYVVKCPPDMELNLHSSNGKVAAIGVKGSVAAKSEFGSVTARNIGGNTEARSSNGAVHVDTITGSVQASSEFGQVSVKDVQGNVEARSSNGAVDVTNVRGDVKAHSSFGKVALKSIAGSVDGSSENGEVRGEAVDAGGKRVALQSGFGSVHFNGKSGTLTGKSSNGRVEADLDNQPASVELSSSFGSVEAKLPADANADVTAHTDFGRVDAGSLKQASVSKADPDGKEWSGRLGTGGNTVKLSSSNGSVTVRQR